MTAHQRGTTDEQQDVELPAAFDHRAADVLADAGRGDSRERYSEDHCRSLTASAREELSALTRTQCLIPLSAADNCLSSGSRKQNRVVKETTDYMIRRSVMVRVGCVQM